MFNLLRRRSGIQLNSTAFDSIPIRTRLSGTKLDNTSPASAATSQSASSDDNRCMSINTKDGINSDGVTSNTYSGANVTNNNAGSYSSISTRTTHYSSAEIIHEAVDSSIRNFSTTRYSASGRSSPEYKDNCPGTMHAPPPLLVGDTSSMDYSSYDYHNNGTPYNYGISSNPALFSSSGLTDNGSSNPNTPYLSTDYIISYNGTPYRARNTPLDADYSNASSAAKVALEFEPENEENTPSSADTSFDCEVVFTSIYSGSPGALQNTVANSGSSAAGATSIVEQDADTFQGENEHFKNNYLEQVTAPKSPERSDITSEKAGIFDSVEQNNDAADSGAPDASGAKFSMSSIFGTATTPTAAAMFELGADDALKLGEVRFMFIFVHHTVYFLFVCLISM